MAAFLFKSDDLHVKWAGVFMNHNVGSIVSHQKNIFDMRAQNYAYWN